MASLHFEPYVHLAGLTQQSVLLSWGGFFFQPSAAARREDIGQIATDDGWRVLDDEELVHLERSRRDSIGERSRSYGDAHVQVLRKDGSIASEARVTDCNHVWLDGLEPDTEYDYRVAVRGEDWLKGERYDWSHHTGEHPGLARSGRRYSTRFRTHPAADDDQPLAFAVLGDFGIGIRTENADAIRQHTLAKALEHAVEKFGVRLVLTTGDNVYLGPDSTGGTGDEDDDWLFTFYQPYRYLLSRIPFYPAVGNHDSSDTEASDDREQLDDNYFLRQRFSEEREPERASVNPGLFYRFRYGACVEFICLDTTYGDEPGERFFESARHRDFLEDSFPVRERNGLRTRWRIPFSHHPVYCAGPSHDNTHEMEQTLVPLFERSNTRLVLAGHEHNFQYSRRHDVHYVLSGAGGQLRTEPPTHFERAHTLAWSAEGHFLVVQLSEREATVHALTSTRDGELRSISLNSTGAEAVSLPLRIEH